MERCVKCRLELIKNLALVTEPMASSPTISRFDGFHLEKQSLLYALWYSMVFRLCQAFLFTYIYILLPVSIYIYIYIHNYVYIMICICVSAISENPEKCWTYRPPNFVSIIHFILSVNWRYLFTSGPSIPEKNSFCSIDVVIGSRLRKVARQLAGHYLSHENRANTNTCQEIDTSAA